MRKLITAFNRRFGYRHWYQITIFYKDKKGNKILDLDRKVGIFDKSLILSNKVISPLNQDIPKIYLCNGKVYFQVHCYLGYFKMKGFK